jgi:hypothetical protein
MKFRLLFQLRPDLEAMAGRKFPHAKVVHYKSQVVAGTNYFAKVTFANTLACNL